MHERLQKILKEQGWKDKKILVAVSGGLDSMVLAAMLAETITGEIAVAHCNFGLRAEESDADEQFVRNWAAARHIPCYVKAFSTRSILQTKGGNLQELARDLRYAWFEEQRSTLGFDLVAVAHHRDDSVETLLLNFFKGTGIAGLHGILPVQQRIIRPLLSFGREEIRAFALQQDISWREDSSNRKEDYMRNAVRHRLLPAIQELFPQAPETLAHNITRFREAEMLYAESVARYRGKLLEQRGRDWYIPLLKLRHVQPLYTILWELLRPFGFSAGQAKEALGLMDAETGRYISSNAYRVIRHRNFLIITPAATTESSHILIAEGQEQATAAGFELSIRRAPLRPGDMENIRKLPWHEICVRADKLHFPLVLRPWKTGDYFYPLGMDRKKKKVSRFLIGEKLPLHEKENVWVLESDKKIVWVVGMRADDRFRMSESAPQGCYISVKRH